MTNHPEPAPHLQTLDGDIQLGPPLGQGGAGTVFEAVQTSLNRPVAVKRLHKLNHASDHRRFAAEAEIMARVAHPNIVPILCHGLLDGTPALVMEKVDGLDLAEVIQALQIMGRAPSVQGLAQALGSDSLPWTVATPWWKVVTTLVGNLARALDHAHRSGFLHHDLKPSNILISRNGTALLADFGIAESLRGSGSDRHPGHAPGMRSDAGPDETSKEASNLSARTQPNDLGLSTSGSVAYAAPEEVQGKPSTQASDLYSLAIIAREFLSLQSPYGDATGQAARIYAIDTGRLAPLVGSLPRDLRSVLDHATSMDPKARYSSSGNFGRDLEAVLEGRAISIRPDRIGKQTRRWIRHNPLTSGVTALLLGLFVAVPASIQYTRLQSALRVQDAMAVAGTHLRLALDGIERMLVDVGREALVGFPKLDIARAELLETGLSLCDDLVGTIEPDESSELVQRIDTVRVKALLGLVSVHSRAGNIDRAKSHLDRLEKSGNQDAILLQARIQYQRVNLAHSLTDYDQIEVLAPALLDTLAGLEESDEYLALMRASVWAALMESSISRGDSKLAVERGQEASAIAREWIKAANYKTIAKRELARVLGSYAAALISADQFSEARSASLEAISLLTELQSSPEIQQLIAISWNNLGAIEREQKNYQAAIQAERRALELQTQAYSVSSKSKSLRFECGRSRYRIALSLRLVAEENPLGPQPATTEVYGLLQAACDDLQWACSQETTSWKKQSVLASAAALLGNLRKQDRNWQRALEAFDIAAQACEAIEKSKPGTYSRHAFRQSVWLGKTAMGLQTQPENGVEILELYVAHFPEDISVIQNSASMLCVLANKARAGKLPGVEDGELKAKALETLALERLAEAADLDGLQLQSLLHHNAWKNLHKLPAYRELVQRVREGEGK